MAAPLTPNAIALLQRALARVQAGDGAGADAALDQLPPAVRGHPDVLTVSAMAARAQGRLESARSLYEAALQAAPHHAGIRNGYANLLADLGDHDAAIAAYEAALAIEPKSAATWTNLGLAAVAARRWDRAETALARALALAPGDPRALTGRGLLEQGRGRPEAAITAYSAALATRPTDTVARHNLAATLRTLGRSEAALATLAPDGPPDSRALRGHLLADLGRFDAAVAEYRAVLAAVPDHAATLAAVAELLPQLGRRDEALAGYRAAVRGAASPALYQAAIAAAMHLGEAAQALDWARAAAATHGPGEPWLLAEAGALSGLGDTAGAMRLGEAAVAQFPQSAAAQKYLAWVRLKSGAADRAEAPALRATQLAPLDQSPWGMLTLIWRLTGDPREAWLGDYARLVIVGDIATPPGWPNLAAFLDDLKAVLTDRHRTIEAPADQSLRGGTQTRGILFETTDPVLLALKASLVACVESGLAGLPDDASHPFLGRRTPSVSLAGSWSVRLRGQGFHISHIHHSGWLSSAFYVDVPPEIGTGSDAGKLLFGVPDASLGLDLGPRRIVTPTPGRLAIFPSYFWHGTAPFESAHARLTVAFDALPGS